MQADALHARTGPHLAGPNNDQIVLTYAADDRTLLLAGRRYRAPAGHLLAYWSAVPHDWTEGGDATATWITIGLKAWLHLQTEAATTDALLRGVPVLDPPRPGDDRQFPAWAEELEASRNDAAARAGRLEVQARMLRLVPGELSTVNAEMTPALRLAGLLAEHHASDLSIAELCERGGLNPNYATGLYKKTFGIGLKEATILHRLATAKRMLLTTDKPLTEIATASGFRSQTRFYAAFAEQVGDPPQAWREAHAV